MSGRRQTRPHAICQDAGGLSRQSHSNDRDPCHASVQEGVRTPIAASHRGSCYYDKALSLSMATRSLSITIVSFIPLKRTARSPDVSVRQRLFAGTSRSLDGVGLAGESSSVRSLRRRSGDHAIWSLRIPIPVAQPKARGTERRNGLRSGLVLDFARHDGEIRYRTYSRRGSRCVRHSLCDRSIRLPLLSLLRTKPTVGCCARFAAHFVWRRHTDSSGARDLHSQPFRWMDGDYRRPRGGEARIRNRSWVDRTQDP